MAISPIERKFNYQIVIRALNSFRNSLNNLPSYDNLVSIANSRTVQSKNNKLNSLQSVYFNTIGKDTVKVINENVEAMALKVARDISMRLSKVGVKLTSEQAIALAKSFTERYRNEKFLGLTQDQRINNILSKAFNNEKKVINYLRSIKDDETKLKKAKLFEEIRNGKRQRASFGGNVINSSVSRQSNRLIVSEIVRSQKKMEEFMAKELGFSYVKWETREDNKVCKVCRDLASLITVSKVELDIPSLEGVYRVGEVPHSHPFCRCRLQIVVTRKDTLAYLAGGQVDSLLGQFGGMDVSSDVSFDYLSEYVKSQKSALKFLDLPENTRVVRSKAYKEMLEERSVRPAEISDRLFFNNVRRGQKQAILDFAKKLGISISEELVDVLGPENCVRLLLSNVKGLSVKAVEEMFKKDVQEKVARSLEIIRFRIDAAKKLKAMESTVVRNSQKMMFRSQAYNQFNYARIEAGQTYGYLDTQARFVNNLKVKGRDLVIQFKNNQAMDDFIAKYSSIKFKVNRSNSVLMVNVNNAGDFISFAKNESASLRRLKQLRAGVFNEGSRVGYSPKGCKNLIMVERDGRKVQIPFRLNKNQETAMRFMKEQKAVILNAMPGTGKTPMTISAIEELRYEDRIKKNVLYVTKNKLEGQVVSEWRKFTDRSDVGLGFSLEERRNLYANKDVRVHVISHRAFIDDVKSGLLNFKNYDVVVIDEYQYIGVEGRNVFSASVRVPYRFALSGTPIQNSVSEMWDIIKWVNPNLFRSRQEFISLFSSVEKATTYFHDAIYRKVNEKLIGNLITIKQDKLEPYIMKDLIVRLSQSSRNKLNSLHNRLSMATTIASGEVKRRIRMNMRSIIDYAVEEKGKALLNVFKKTDGMKKIIFVADSKQADLVRKYLIKNGFSEDSIFELLSSTKRALADSVKAAYRNCSDQNAVIIMDKTQVAGHDLFFSGVVVNWNLPSNYAALGQRIARAWRIGNVRTEVYNLFVDDVEDLVRLKSRLNETKNVFSLLYNAEAIDKVGILSLLGGD